MTNTSIFVCQQCGNEYSKWMGKCNACNSWNSLVESVRITGKSKSQKTNNKQTTNTNNQIQKLTDIKASQMQRTSTGLSELDRALGGGLVNGQVVLLAGEPGIGKSTMLLQLANNLDKTIYVSGEESASQVGIRAERLGIKNKNIDFLESTDVDEIIGQLNAASTLNAVIIDSIQTMSTTDLTGLAGSVGQVRECTFRLLKYVKSQNIPLILVGHVTKEGTVAGPAVLAHIVDTVLWFEGDKKSNLRLLRSVKNRFGSTDEVGIFSMEDKGLISLDNPEKLFLESDKQSVAGSVVSILMEGSRSILVEIQSLVVPTKMAFPRRVAQGIDSKRLEMLLAVLFRRANVPMYDMDVFVNVAGGIKANDPSMDLAICLSVASSFYEKPLPKKFIAVGEIGLSGELRKVGMQEKRIKDAKRLGFNDVADSTSFKYLSQVIKSYLK